MQYSEEGEQLKDKSPCAELRARLKMCLLDSDCCKKVRKINHFYYDNNHFNNGWFSPTFFLIIFSEYY